MPFQYKNKTDKRLVIPNVGEVEPYGTIDSEIALNNPNLQLIKDLPKNEPVQAVQEPVQPTPEVVSPEDTEVKQEDKN